MAKSFMTPTRKRAAWHLARTSMSFADVASAVGVESATLHNWTKVEEFAAYVQEQLEQELAEVHRLPYIRKSDRLRGYSEKMSNLDELIRIRASATHTPQDLEAGMGTGLVVRRYKSVGSGEFAYTVTEYETDLSPYTESRNYSRQIAQELGEWEVKEEGVSTGTVVVQFIEREDGPQ